MILTAQHKFNFVILVNCEITTYFLHWNSSDKLINCKISISESLQEDRHLQV